MRNINNTNLKWQIGDVEIYQLPEIEAGEIIQSTMPDATPEVIKDMKWLQPNFSDENGIMKALVQSFLIKSQGLNILIDTCNGNDKNRPSMEEWSMLNTNFLDQLTNLDIKPKNIDIVACTHLHFDHVGWNTRLVNGKWVPTFPNAKYLFSKNEYKYWKSNPSQEMEDDLIGFKDSVKPILDKGLAELVDDNHSITDQIRLIPTPGHSPAHVSVEIESEGKKALISGDFIYHPCQVEEPKWGNDVDTYPDQAYKTRRTILDSITDTETILLGSHFSNPVAGKVKTKDNMRIFEILK